METHRRGAAQLPRTVSTPTEDAPIAQKDTGVTFAESELFDDCPFGKVGANRTMFIGARLAIAKHPRSIIPPAKWSLIHALGAAEPRAETKGCHRAKCLDHIRPPVRARLLSRDLSMAVRSPTRQRAISKQGAIEVVTSGNINGR